MSASKGLPEAPEGHFWRIGQIVERFTGFGSYWKFGIALMRTDYTRFRKRPYDTQVESIETYTTEISIQVGAQKLLENYRERELRKELSGDYPPKTLGGHA